MWCCRKARISLWRLVRGTDSSVGVAVRPNRARTTIPEDRPKDKMPVTLDQILTSTREGLPSLHARRTAVEREAAEAPQAPSLVAALRRSSVGVIAEVKRRSPSAEIGR